VRTITTTTSGDRVCRMTEYRYVPRTLLDLAESNPQEATAC
jgi:hypothetical protein